MLYVCPECRAGEEYLTRTRLRNGLLHRIKYRVTCERCGYSERKEEYLP